VRIAFLGTPDDAVPALRGLVGAGHRVAVVVTQPNRRRGRGSASGPTPVRAAAEALGLSVLTPSRAGEVAEDIRRTGAELGVVVAFGQLLPERLLQTLPHGFVNLHFSLLPRWRGAAPVERAILAGDTETGVTVMRIDAGLDTGPVYATRRTTIRPDETAGALRARLVELGTAVLLETVPRVPSLEPVPQVGEATYAEKLTVEEFRIDWSSSAEDIARMVRAGNPRPGAWSTVDGARLKIWSVATPVGPTPAASLDGVSDVPAPGQLVDDVVGTGDGGLRILEVQPEGKARMTLEAWRAGHRSPVVLGAS
jgi:methionyl-tRNA formyltransferase